MNQAMNHTLTSYSFKMMENSFVSFFAAVVNQNMCRGRQLSAKSSVVINTLIHVSLHIILRRHVWFLTGSEPNYNN